MNKLTKNSHYLVTGLLILIAFFGMAFPLIKTSGFSENGFNMISFGSNSNVSQTFLYFTYVICLLQFLLCVSAIIFFMITLKMKNREWENKVFNIFNWIILGFLIAYMILGIVFVALANNAIKFYTLAYMPAVLGAFVFTANYIFTKVNSEKEKPAAKTSKEKPAKPESEE